VLALKSPGGGIRDAGNVSGRSVPIQAYSVQLQVRLTTGRAGHPQHGLRYRGPGPDGPAGDHGGITFATVRTPSPPPTASAFTASTTSSRQVETASLRSPR
jgi:hypothetical protein